LISVIVFNDPLLVRIMASDACYHVIDKGEEGAYSVLGGFHRVPDCAGRFYKMWARRMIFPVLGRIMATDTELRRVSWVPLISNGHGDLDFRVNHMAKEANLLLYGAARAHLIVGVEFSKNLLRVTAEAKIVATRILPAKKSGVVKTDRAEAVPAFLKRHLVACFAG
jgi:hypothetical protein